MRGELRATVTATVTRGGVTRSANAGKTVICNIIEQNADGSVSQKTIRIPIDANATVAVQT